MSTAAIVILNYNGRHHLERYLPSVVKYSEENPIYVIDNGSSDESLVFLSSHYPSIHQIKLTENYGYCGGYNRGLKQIEEDVYILLNSDIELRSIWISPIIEAFNQDTKLAAAQPVIRSLKKPDYYEYAGAAGGFIDQLGYPFCRGRIFDTLEKVNSDYASDKSIFWATGACLFIRKDIFRKVGGLDEDFFAHMEEIDLCWRAINQGYHIKCIANSEVYHLGGGTLDYGNPRKIFLNYRNNLRTIVKNTTRVDLLRILLSRTLLDSLALFNFIFKGKFSSAFAIPKAYFSLLGEMRKWLRKRKQNGEKKSMRTLHRLVLQGILPIEYYAKNNKKFTDLDLDT